MTTTDLKAIVLALLANDATTPCQTHDDPGLWLSDDEEEREAAAYLCTGCPVLRECFDAGRKERFGVWGGRDREPKPRPRKPASPDIESSGFRAPPLANATSTLVGHKSGHNAPGKHPKPHPERTRP